LAAMSEGAVVERKTPSDLVACMTSARDRFERELARSRYLGQFVVVVEGSLEDVLAARRQMSEASLIGTLAAWQRRYTGFVFAGTVELAARFSFRFLAGQVAEIERAHRNINNKPAVQQANQ
jgi:ERCC4-type nuclease